MSEERVSSQRVFDGKLVRVRVDRVRLETGRETGREVVEHPGAVAILPVVVSSIVSFSTYDPGRSAAGKAKRYVWK